MIASIDLVLQFGGQNFDQIDPILTFVLVFLWIDRYGTPQHDSQNHALSHAVIHNIESL